MFILQRTQAFDEGSSLEMLPERLRAEIAIHVHLDTLRKVSPQGAKCFVSLCLVIGQFNQLSENAKKIVCGLTCFAFRLVVRLFASGFGAQFLNYYLSL